MAERRCKYFSLTDVIRVILSLKNGSLDQYVNQPPPPSGIKIANNRFGYPQSVECANPASCDRQDCLIHLKAVRDLDKQE
jgi:hypothetical protein